MERFYIPHRKEGEKIILLLRRHHFVLLVKIGFWAIVALLPLTLYFFIRDTFAGLFANPLSAPLVTLFLSTYYLYVWLFAFHSFVDYYLDVWVVTNRRVVNIEQHGLFARTVAEQVLYRVQDITAEVKGFFQTFIDFGDIYIQTAGERARFIFKQIPNPYGTARKITQLVEESKKFHQLMEQKDEVRTK